MPSAQPSFQSSGNKNFLVFFLVVLIALIITTLFYYQKSKTKTLESQLKDFVRSEENLSKRIKNQTTPAPFQELKTYTNTKYGFQLSYPQKGVIQTENGLSQGECGKEIKEIAEDAGSRIMFDNIVSVQILSWTGSIEDYLISRGGKNIYNYEPVKGSGADEAIKLNGLKKGVEYAVGYPPLVFVNYIYRKNGWIFISSDFQAATNIGGCISSRATDPIKYPQISNQKWEFVKNFRFIP